MYTGCNNWTEAVNYVLLTGRLYVHEELTIEKADGTRSIVIRTLGKLNRMTPEEASIYLETNFVF